MGWVLYTHTYTHIERMVAVATVAAGGVQQCKSIPLCATHTHTNCIYFVVSLDWRGRILQNVNHNTVQRKLVKIKNLKTLK